MAEEQRRRALGKAIRVRRNLIDLSRGDLAKAAGLSYPYISEIENGAKSPSMDALTRIAQALEMEFSELAALGEGFEEDAAGETRSIPRTATQLSARTPPGRGDGTMTAFALAVPGEPANAVGDAPTPGSGDDLREVVRAELARFERERLPELVRDEVRRILAERTIDE